MATVIDLILFFYVLVMRTRLREVLHQVVLSILSNQWHDINVAVNLGVPLLLLLFEMMR